MTKIGQRMFPGRKKRTVWAELTTFHNVCSDAHHYYVQLTEECNPVWTGKSWRWSSDDKEGKGKEFPRATFHDYKSAEQYCKTFFKGHFNKKTHKLMIKTIE